MIFIRPFVPCALAGGGGRAGGRGHESGRVVVVVVGASTIMSCNFLSLGPKGFFHCLSLSFWRPCLCLFCRPFYMAVVDAVFVAGRAVASPGGEEALKD